MGKKINKLYVIDGDGAKERNAMVARSMNNVAATIAENPNEIASYGYVIAYKDGTIGMEYGGRNLTTLLGGAVCLVNRIEREL